MEIYTDGSFNKKRSMNVSGYSVIIIKEELEDSYLVDIISGVTTEPEYTSMWNVGGEIWAVITGLDYVINKYNPTDIKIYHDYIGLSMWVNDKWKTKKAATYVYAKYVKEFKKSHEITFIHVKGHSNNLLNDVADKYAKLGIDEFLKCGKETFLFPDIRISKK